MAVEIEIDGMPWYLADETVEAIRKEQPEEESISKLPDSLFGLPVIREDK